MITCLQNPAIPLTFTKQPILKQKCITVQAKGTMSMRYQWIKDDEDLSECDDFKGSTSPELVIVGTGPQVKGNYKCRVTNKYRKILSNEIHYGKLICTFPLHHYHNFN